MKENLEAERKQKQKWNVAVNSKSAHFTMICGFGRNRKSEEARSSVVVVSSLSPAVSMARRAHSSSDAPVSSNEESYGKEKHLPWAPAWTSRYEGLELCTHGRWPPSNT